MGLRERERDPELPAMAGDAQLRPPAAADVVGLVATYMKRPATPAIVGASWEYARWKPGISITSVHRLRLADGAEEVVVAKRYADGKERTLQLRPREELDFEELSPRLLPWALLVERSLALWTPPADRVLRGLPVLLDRRQLGNLVVRSGIAAPGSIKKRKTGYSLLRYKPERRALYRLDLRLRTEGQAELSLAGRALPPAEAARVIAARERLRTAGGAELAPALAATNRVQGFLLEPWLALTSFAGDDFGHANAAGELLARLHGLHAPAELRAAPRQLPGELDRLLAVDPALARIPRSHPPAPQGRVIVHGDFHPDQVARRSDGRWILMDLDCLATGDPLSDLGSWSADWMVEHQRVDLDAAAGALLAGYRSGGGRAHERAQLATWTAAELVRRAASSLRRLEKDAIEKARFALEAAHELAPGGES